VVRRALGIPAGPTAVALRGYAPTPPARAGEQVIVFDTGSRPAYAWSFDRGDGLCNVGYGVLTGSTGSAGLTKAHLLARLDALLPGAADGGTSWQGHQLPLSAGPWRPRPGSVLLAGDAAGLVNPMTGEGIYYAVATGLAAGRAAAEALAAGDPASAGARQAAAVAPLLDAHLRHVRLAARLCRHGSVLSAGLRAASADQRVFDDLVELGLARGRITPRVAAGLAGQLARRPARRPDRPGSRREALRTTPTTRAIPEETPPCES
jgi:flavin-dependent dehydrogenase